MKRPPEPAATATDWVRVYIWRAHKMLGAALAGEAEGPRGWLPLPSSAEERAHYRALMRAAAQLYKVVAENEAAGNTLANDAMLQFGMLMDIGKGWIARRARPVTSKLFAQRTAALRNLAAKNNKRTTDAENEILKAFASWQRRARTQLWKNGKPLPARKRAELFVKISSYKPRSGQRRRLFALVAAGRLPDPPPV